MGAETETTVDIGARARALAAADQAAVRRRTDRLFAWLLVAEWLAGVAVAVWASPPAWAGTASRAHPHVWAAAGLGLLIVAVPVRLAAVRPGRPSTRLAVAAGQMLMSGLLIHLSGGRIEPYPLVFGSLAFLAFYRDWRVLAVATAVTGADHLARGLWWPESAYGTAAGGGWRWAEHAAWVAFVDIFLLYAIRQGLRDVARGAEREAALEVARAAVERDVACRTRELWDTEELLRSTFDDAAIGMAVLAPDGRFLGANRVLCELVGYTPDELRARRCADVTHPDDRAGDAEADAQLLAGADRMYEREKRYVGRDGRVVWARKTATLVRAADGSPRHLIVQVQDVADQRKAEEELRAARAAAESASRIKSEFLANMSHEIRTPMNGILGMTDLILETNLSREQRESLGLVKSSAEALLGIINDILDFSKIEAGKLELDPTPLFLRDVIADTLKPLAFPAHAKGLELACDVRPEVPDLAVGDPVRLRQVLTNLVGNAIKFTATGEVVVRAELVDEPADGFRVRFGVTDTGIGIPADKLGSIFDPFTQADGSTTRRFGGSGLGLTICARLVGMMGGRIWVESEPGRGSTFFFEVRLDRARVSAERPAPLSADVRGTAALVVDDNATNRRVLEDTLKNWGARPVAVDSGPAALAELRRAAAAGTAYPLVLLDAMMPGMDGFEVAAEVGKDPALSGAAVLMLTSADATGDAARCRALGVAAYLVKPVKGSELNAAIAAALGGRAARTRIGVPIPEDLPPAAGTADRPLKVLVAEDNAVNQRVILRLLEKYGHKAVVANHGGEAIAALDRDAFDVVFMDVQMPEVDGFAATKVIRDREAAGHRYGGWPRLPIVAMTAHAMKGDRERCLANGMDDYVSKPVQRPELLRVLGWAAGMRSAEGGRRNQDGHNQPPGSDSAVRDSQSATSEVPPLDREAALERLGGDEELFAEVAALFLSDAPRMVEDIRRAAEVGDPVTLQRAAHTLKGAAGYVGGVAAAAAAHQVEQLATAGQLGGVAAPVAEVARETDRLRAALTVTLTPAPAA